MIFCYITPSHSSGTDTSPSNTGGSVSMSSLCQCLTRIAGNQNPIVNSHEDIIKPALSFPTLASSQINECHGARGEDFEAELLPTNGFYCVRISKDSNSWRFRFFNYCCFQWNLGIKNFCNFSSKQFKYIVYISTKPGAIPIGV